MKIVRAKYPNAQFVTDLWQEGARLTQEGYLISAGSSAGVGRHRLRRHAGRRQGRRRPGALLPRGHDERPGQSAFRNGAGLDHSVGDRPLHQGRRHFLFPRQHQRPAAGGHDYPRRDGNGLGRSARESTDVDGASTRSGPPRSSAQSLPTRWQASTRNTLRRRRCALASVLQDSSAPPDLFHLRNSAPFRVRKAINTTTRKCAGSFWIRSPCTRSFRSPSQSPKWSLPGLMPTAPVAMRQSALKRDIEECSDERSRAGTLCGTAQSKLRN